MASTTTAVPSGAHIIKAPERPIIDPSRPSIFLAGTTTKTDSGDWRETLCATLQPLGVTIFNPVRPDWDETWKEDLSDERFKTQVQWELEMQDRADLIVIFFHSATPAPISLLELGLCVRSGKAIACAMDGYSKAGNVEAVCQRYRAIFVRTEEELRDAVLKWLVM